MSDSGYSIIRKLLDDMRIDPTVPPSTFKLVSPSAEVIADLRNPRLADTVWQLAVDGPAKGQLFERPLSEEDVYLPWQCADTYVSGVCIKGRIVMYYPYRFNLFGRTVTVLSLEDPEVLTPAYGDLFDMLISDDAKKTVPAAKTLVIEAEHD
jgi:outer membrane lipoprotein-sorting protein